MNQKVVAYLVVAVGLLTVLVVSVLSHSSLEAQREVWQIERQALLDSHQDRIAEIESESESRMSELVMTVQRQAEERLWHKKELEETRAKLEQLQATLEAELERAAEARRAAESARAETEAVKGLHAETAARAATLEKQLAAQTDDREALQSSLTGLKTLLEELRTRAETSEKALAARFDDLQAVQAERDKLAGRFDALDAKVDASTKALGDATTALAGVNAELEKARELAAARRLQTDALRAELAKLETVVASAVVEARRARAAARTTPPRAPGTSTGDVPDRVTDTPPPPKPEKPIEGIVAAFDEPEGVVVVSVGTLAGIQPGMRLHVYEEKGRITTRIATLRADDLFRDYSGCTIIASDPERPIARGYRVSTE